MYQIVTGVTSDVGVPSTYLVLSHFRLIDSFDSQFVVYCNCASLRDLSHLNFTCSIRQFPLGFTSTTLVATAFIHIAIIIRTASNLPFVCSM